MCVRTTKRIPVAPNTCSTADSLVRVLTSNAVDPRSSMHAGTNAISAVWRGGLTVLTPRSEKSGFPETQYLSGEGSSVSENAARRRRSRWHAYSMCSPLSWSCSFSSSAVVMGPGRNHSAASSNVSKEHRTGRAAAEQRPELRASRQAGSVVRPGLADHEPLERRAHQQLLAAAAGMRAAIAGRFSGGKYRRLDHGGNCTRRDSASLLPLRRVAWVAPLL